MDSRDDGIGSRKANLGACAPCSHDLQALEGLTFVRKFEDSGTVHVVRYMTSHFDPGEIFWGDCATEDPKRALNI